MKRQCTFTVNRFRYNHRDMFRIRCRSVAGESPVGSRLERGEPMPQVQESYETEAEAKEAAAVTYNGFFLAENNLKKASGHPRHTGLSWFIRCAVAGRYDRVVA